MDYYRRLNIATVNYIKYKSQVSATLKGVIAYVCKRDKVTINRNELDIKHNVNSYSTQQYNPLKLISGLNCSPESACAEFFTTKASYNKTDGIQFYHYTQSFKDGENISPKLAHEIALEFARKHYNHHEVLIATHIDNDHLHSHFIINSVSFKNGMKLRQSPSTLRTLRKSSDEICKAHGLSTLETYTYGKSKSRGETSALKKGSGWKYNLCVTIENAMKKSHEVGTFIDELHANGYDVIWSRTRKTLTYICPNGRKVCDDKLYGKKYLKGNMEREFEIRADQDFETDVKTGWEYERKFLFSENKVANINSLSSEIFTTIHNIEKANNYDDELALIANLTVLTALSAIGVYLLIEHLKDTKTEITDKEIEEIIDDLKQEPENNIDFEEEQDFGFTMMM